MISIIEAVVPIICTAVSGYIVWLLQEQKKEQKTRDKTYQILLRAEIRQLHDKYMGKGSISTEEMGELKDIYDTYHKLGGNGLATVMMQDVEKLRRAE